MDRRRRKLLRLVACAAVLVLENTSGKRKRKRRMWRKNRPLDLTAFDSQNDFFRFVKMTCEDFGLLLERLGPRLARQDTQFRKAIPSRERLSLTLRFLATGESLQSLSCTYRMGNSTTSNIVKETCTAIHQLLREDFLQMPDSAAAWRRVADGFLLKCRFPHCVGAVDAKRISLHPQGSNDKRSALLTAAADARSSFLFVNVAPQTEDSDAFVFEESDFGRALDRGALGLPSPEPPPGSDRASPYVFVGDEAFPLRSDLMVPFPGDDTDDRRALFNRQLSGVRRAAENALGILTSRWRVFHTSIPLQPEKVERVVLATVCLHNFLCGRRSEAYLPAGGSDGEPGSWRSDGLGIMKSVRRDPTGGGGGDGEAVRNAMMDSCRALSGKT